MIEHWAGLEIKEAHEGSTRFYRKVKIGSKHFFNACTGYTFSWKCPLNIIQDICKNQYPRKSHGHPSAPFSAITEQIIHNPFTRWRTGIVLFVNAIEVEKQKKDIYNAYSTVHPSPAYISFYSRMYSKKGDSWH
jgi:hypothetical protein